MKKTIVMLFLIIIASSVNAQKLKESDVPYNIKEAFKKSYPEAKELNWEKEKDGNYEANFEIGEVEQSLTLDRNGNMVELEEEIAVAELPEAAKAYLSKNYQGSKIKEAAKITDSKGVVTFEAEVKGMDLIFDNAGKLLKEIKE